MIDLKAGSVLELTDEVKRARTKFPHNALLLAALVEEVGELAEALRQPDGADAYHDQVREEARQSACVAMRIYEEGDPSFARMYPADREKYVFSEIVETVGKLAKALLQKREAAASLYLGMLMGLAQRMARDGDPMFAEVTEAQAKP